MEGFVWIEVVVTAGKQADSGAQDYSLKHSLAQMDNQKLLSVLQRHVAAQPFRWGTAKSLGHIRLQISKRDKKKNSA